MIGKTLGTFECTALLGKGGMGEVYKAKDQKLGRDVAIKVLPEEFAKDKDRVARFQREAKLLASLNHPNIAAIYGLEEADGTHFLVMELVEGITLEDYIAGNAGVSAGKRAAETTALPGLLKLALQIAEALEAAHEKGVIHRDLKPANIKVTPDGKVKVLDFGLAKAFAGEQAEVNLSNSPTLSEAATLQGVILGTAAYMSPEQARGKPVDKRTDIWAFGCVLYEMLTGKAAFQGEDVTEILAAVIRAEPEWNKLPENLHWRLREVLERCLEKEIKDRYSGISDARVDIQKVFSDPNGLSAQPLPMAESRSGDKTILPWIIALLGIIIVGTVFWYLQPKLPAPQVTRFFVELPEGHTFGSDTGPNLALSPDGSVFAVSTSMGIYLRSMNELNIKLVAGTEESTLQPFFSPDGNFIGYWSIDDEQLKKVSVTGGTPRPLCKDQSTAYYYWATDGNIYYATGTGIMRVSENGGEPETVIPSNDGETFFSPQLLPDGKSVIYTLDAGEEYQIALQSLHKNDRRILLEGSTALYLETGHLIYMVGNELQARPFDIDKLKPTGGAVPLVEDLLVNGPPHFCVSSSGTFAYLRNIYSNQSLVWVNFDGTEEMINAEPDIYSVPRVSPDGDRIALIIQDDNAHPLIGILDIARGNITRLSSNMGYVWDPNWTSDSQKIVFSGSSGASYAIGIYQMSSSGTGKVEHLYTEPGRQIYPISFSKDGKFLLCQISPPGRLRNIGMLTTGEDLEWQMLLQDKYNKTQPWFSPDGKWIAYTSNKSGRNEVYVRSFPNVEEELEQVSTDGGDSPLWSPISQQLYYRNSDHVIAATYETKQGFKVVNSKDLFPDTYYNAAPYDISWDIHPDGKRFLMMKEATTNSKSGQSRPRIDIIQNWFEELKERVPVD